MNIGQAIQWRRTKRGSLARHPVARQTNWPVSYLPIAWHEPTLSTLTRVAQALQVPVGLLFFLASEQEDLGPMDENTIGMLMQSALASLAKPTNVTMQSGEQHG